jgi:hypothetical protein
MQCARELIGYDFKWFDTAGHSSDSSSMAASLQMLTKTGRCQKYSGAYLTRREARCASQEMTVRKCNG